MSDPLYTGGCQCGAVRYALHAELTLPHLCHCRMCQKAFGSFFAALAVIDEADIEWTRGKPKIFRSSSITDRGFCDVCGTPLTFQMIEGTRVNISLGSLDNPEMVPPDIQIGIESRLPWFADLPGLKEHTTEEAIPAERLARIKSYQHPDHPTDTWPPAD